jgi:hypothetical protein
MAGGNEYISWCPSRVRNKCTFSGWYIAVKVAGRSNGTILISQLALMIVTGAWIFALSTVLARSRDQPVFLFMIRRHRGTSVFGIEPGQGPLRIITLFSMRALEDRSKAAPWEGASSVENGGHNGETTFRGPLCLRFALCLVCLGETSIEGQRCSVFSSRSPSSRHWTILPVEYRLGKEAMAEPVRLQWRLPR